MEVALQATKGIQSTICKLAIVRRCLDHLFLCTTDVWPEEKTERNEAYINMALLNAVDHSTDITRRLAAFIHNLYLQLPQPEAGLQASIARIHGDFKLLFTCFYRKRSS